ncbi:MAG: hypothetical protein JRI62_05245 [Deltaproteobacteria bacterium]|nr:hypothetical protein [Deltaproteobacteria bacterium]
MSIADETTAKEAIDMWRNKDPKEQLRQIRLSIESLKRERSYKICKRNRYTVPEKKRNRVRVIARPKGVRYAFIAKLAIST